MGSIPLRSIKGDVLWQKPKEKLQRSALVD